MADSEGFRSAVLVVDDDPPTRQTLRFLLEDAGYTVLETDSGEQVLTILRSSTERLVVLLDYLLPDLDGVSLLRQVARDRPLIRHHAFIFMTARRISTRLGLLRFLALLQVPLLRKPFDIDEVLEAVARAARRGH